MEFSVVVMYVWLLGRASRCEDVCDKTFLKKFGGVRNKMLKLYLACFEQELSPGISEIEGLNALMLVGPDDVRGELFGSIGSLSAGIQELYSEAKA